MVSRRSRRRAAPCVAIGRMTLPRIAAVRCLEDYALELTFRDGIVARLDFEHKISGRGGVFAPLSDVRYFQQRRRADAQRLFRLRRVIVRATLNVPAPST